MLAVQGDINQRGFVAHAADRRAAALGVPGMQRHFDPDRIRAPSAASCACARALSCVCASAPPSAEASAGRTAASASFSQAEASAVKSAQRCAAAMRTSVDGSASSMREFFRVRRQHRDAENALRGIGMLVQGGT